MGLFDYVRCDYPLPDGKPMPKDLFQTKDFPAPYMNHYTITAAGRLIAHRTRDEDVPIADEDLNWHGWLNFYGGDEPGEWREFRAKFTDG